jgi:DNA replication and repair protein RecF
MIALRAASAVLLREIWSDPPILLLDDVLSELDPDHRASLLSAFPSDSQIIMTIPDTALLDKTFDTGAKKFRISRGKIETVE